MLARELRHVITYDVIGLALDDAAVRQRYYHTAAAVAAESSGGLDQVISWR